MVKHLDNQSFTTEVLKASVPVLVDFYADWCGPCKMMAPILDEIDTQLGDKVSVCKVNVDNNMDLAQTYRIMNIPAMFIFKNGEIAEKIIGATSKSNLVSLLEKHM
ncbi:MAG: thioredoxin [Clostridiales bacterium]|nr:thioredoxin [Clostridiales bacterium]MDY3745481.1 thioredoxin [Lachnospiraceae bacterium]